MPRYTEQQLANMYKTYRKAGYSAYAAKILAAYKKVKNARLKRERAAAVARARAAKARALAKRQEIARKKRQALMNSLTAKSSNNSRLTKAAFVLPGAEPQMIEFHLNPESLKRDIELSESSGGGNKTGQEKVGMGSDLRTDQRLGQKLSIEFMLDAKEYPDDKGLLPILSAIERLMEPEQLASSETSAEHKNPPFTLRQVLFRWGTSYLLPVKIENLSIEESEFYRDLTPIRAKVSIEMKMLIPDTTQGVSMLMKDAYKHTIEKRKEHADSYFNNKKLDKDGVLPSYRDASPRE